MYQFYMLGPNIKISKYVALAGQENEIQVTVMRKRANADKNTDYGSLEQWHHQH